MLSAILEQNRCLLQGTGSYMLPVFDRIITSLKQLEITAGEEFLKVFTRQDMPKGTYLLEEGQMCRHIWLLEKGIVSLFARKPHAEVIRYFFFPGEFFEGFKSAAFNEPSRINLRLITRGKVITALRSDLESLAVRFPLIAEVRQLITDCHTAWLEEYIDRFKFSTAEQRYQHMMCTQPNLLRHIPLLYLASYLGIAPESLSRIRLKAVA